MKTAELKQQALDNATSHTSMANYRTIFEGFIEKGISPNDIRPRENVFTFWAWKALGRRVRKGEHGVKVLTWVPMEGKAKAEPDANPEPQPTKTKRTTRPWTTTVFHISQTEPEPIR